MNWNLKKVSQKCAVSDNAFKDGDTILCVVVRSDNGDLVRYDMLKSYVSGFSTTGVVLGQWEFTFSGNRTVNTSQDQRLLSQEEFFLSLYNGNSTHETDVLKQLLALLLEKKRVLRFLGFSKLGLQRFLHIRTQKEYLVSSEKIPIEDFISVENLFFMDVE